MASSLFLLFSFVCFGLVETIDKTMLLAKSAFYSSIYQQQSNGGTNGFSILFYFVCFFLLFITFAQNSLLKFLCVWTTEAADANDNTRPH